MNHVLRHLRRMALLSGEDGPSDAQLLESFLVRRDEVAFEALLRRHGPMVLGVCQRVLRNVHDAEDALQATFLVLARKASSIRSRQVVAGWLYGVAYRTAMKTRVMNAKRRTKEREAGQMPRFKPPADEELLARLDHELNRLPDKYRVPIVVCELEGRSRKEAARMLNIPEGTLSWRLAHAKKLLAKRLSRYELAIPLGVLAVGLSPTLRASTLQSVLTAGAVPAKVLTLTEGVIKAMLLSKLKITACATTLMVLAGVGATGLTYRVTAEQPARAQAEAGRPQADDLEALRLEIEALRKSLQATRERVKTLEGEVSALKQQRQGRQGMAPERGTMPSDTGDFPRAGRQVGPPGGMRGRGRPGGGSPPSGRMPPDMPGGGRPGGGPPGAGGMPPGQPGSMAGPMNRRRTSDPLSDAETAFKKLRTNPGDKKATEALEQALQQLKEREKQNSSGQGNPENPIGR